MYRRPDGPGKSPPARADEDAARLVADGASEHDWLPGPLEAREPSLGGEEIVELYRLSHTLRDEEPELLEGALPDPAGFPSAREFASLHDDLADLERSRPADGQDLSTVPAPVSIYTRDDIVASGALKLDGVLPTNTSGGQLSEAHVEGMLQIVEGVRQLQGKYGPDRQVKDAEIGLISGHGGNTVCESTLILGTA